MNTSRQHPADERRTYGQNRRLHGLLHQLGLSDEDRHYLVWQFTSGRTHSSRDMKMWECNNLLHHLEQELDDTLVRMRRKVFSLCHELGWLVPSTGKIDYERLNNWMLKYSTAHKALLKCTRRELPQVITVLEKMAATPDRRG